MIVALTDSDGLALSMLFIMMLALGTVGLLAACIYRNSKLPRSPEDDLLDELNEFDQTKPAPETPKTRPTPATEKEQLEDWQKDSDWWKGGSAS